MALVFNKPKFSSTPVDMSKVGNDFNVWLHGVRNKYPDGEHELVERFVIHFITNWMNGKSILNDPLDYKNKYAKEALEGFKLARQAYLEAGITETVTVKLKYVLKKQKDKNQFNFFQVFLKDK